MMSGLRVWRRSWEADEMEKEFRGSEYVRNEEWEMSTKSNKGQRSTEEVNGTAIYSTSPSEVVSNQSRQCF